MIFDHHPLLYAHSRVRASFVPIKYSRVDLTSFSATSNSSTPYLLVEHFAYVAIIIIAAAAAAVALHLLLVVLVVTVVVVVVVVAV